MSLRSFRFLLLADKCVYLVQIDKVCFSLFVLTARLHYMADGQITLAHVMVNIVRRKT